MQLSETEEREYFSQTNGDLAEEHIFAWLKQLSPVQYWQWEKNYLQFAFRSTKRS